MTEKNEALKELVIRRIKEVISLQSHYHAFRTYTQPLLEKLIRDLEENSL